MYRNVCQARMQSKLCHWALNYNNCKCQLHWSFSNQDISFLSPMQKSNRPLLISHGLIPWLLPLFSCRCSANVICKWPFLQTPQAFPIIAEKSSPLIAKFLSQKKYIYDCDVKHHRSILALEKNTTASSFGHLVAQFGIASGPNTSLPGSYHVAGNYMYYFLAFILVPGSETCSNDLTAVNISTSALPLGGS